MSTLNTASRRTRKPGSVLGAVTAGLLLATPLTATAAPEAAAAGCRDNGSREIDTPWFNTDINEVNVCISQNPTGEYRAVIHGHFTDGGDGSRKFDKFQITVRIEQGDDIQVKANTCDDTREINALSSNALQCVVEGVPVGGGAISADGYITYNVNSDGEGDQYWRLRGSPSM